MSFPQIGLLIKNLCDLQSVEGTINLMNNSSMQKQQQSPHNNSIVLERNQLDIKVQNKLEPNFL